jgi:hypothetical protein
LADELVQLCGAILPSTRLVFDGGIPGFPVPWALRSFARILYGPNVDAIAESRREENMKADAALVFYYDVAQQRLYPRSEAVGLKIPVDWLRCVPERNPVTASRGTRLLTGRM